MDSLPTQNRRGFLRTLLTGAAAVAVAPYVPLPSRKAFSFLGGIYRRPADALLYVETPIQVIANGASPAYEMWHTHVVELVRRPLAPEEPKTVWFDHREFDTRDGRPLKLQAGTRVRLRLAAETEARKEQFLFMDDVLFTGARVGV